jgi:predicted PurR-regulated permease PerM
MLERIKNKYLIIFVVIIFFRITEEISFIKTILSMVKILTPLFIGLAMAFVLNIPMSFFEKWILKKVFHDAYTSRKVYFSRGLATLFSLCLIIAVIISILVYAGPEIVQSLTDLAKHLPLWIKTVSSKLSTITSIIPGISKYFTKFDLNILIDTFFDSKNFTIDTTMTFMEHLFGNLGQSLFGLVLAVYILFNKERLAIQTKRAIYAAFSDVNAEYILRISRLAELRFRGFVKSQILGALSEGLLFFLSLWIFGFGYPFMMASIMAILAVIPIFGSIAGIIIGAALSAVISPGRAIWFVILHICLQQFQENIIYPRIVGAAIGLNGFWVLFAVSVGAGLGGMNGIIFSIPVTSILYTIAIDYIDYYLELKKIPPENYL